MGFLDGLNDFFKGFKAKEREVNTTVNNAKSVGKSVQKAGVTVSKLGGDKKKEEETKKVEEATTEEATTEEATTEESEATEETTTEEN